MSVESDESTESGYACAANCLETLEYTPLEPEVQETKVYLPAGLMLIPPASFNYFRYRTINLLVLP